MSFTIKLTNLKADDISDDESTSSKALFTKLKPKSYVDISENEDYKKLK